MSKIRIVHGTATIEIEPLIDSSVINTAYDGTMLDRVLDVRYEMEDLRTAIDMVVAVAAAMSNPAPVEDDGGTP